MKFAVAVFLLAAAVQVYARPEGAPLGACADIFPVGHTNPVNQVTNPTPESNSPWQLNLLAFRLYLDMTTPDYRYYPGIQYYLTLEDSANGTSFRGLLVQARQEADGTPVGTFSGFTDNTRASFCDPTTSAVTHSNGNDKQCEVLTWTAPANGTGTIRFHYSVVQQYSPGSSNRFYGTLMTRTIAESADIMPTGNNPTCGDDDPTDPDPTDGGLTVAKALSFWSLTVVAIFLGLSHLL